MSLLDLSNVDAYYGESHILRDVTMSVEEGEICALLGRNGAGKTTTLRSIAGATPPEVRDGTVTFKGRDITGTPAEDVSAGGISLVPEERRIFPNLTVAENLHLAEVVRNKSNTWGRSLSFDHEGMSTEDVYAQFPRLDERRSQRAGTLSGGEQQMLAIARALKQSTDLLLLDEPYEGLAPKIIEDVEEAVRQISEDGTTILLVEQNAAAAIKLADRAYVIDQGGIVFDGTADELRADEATRERYLGV
ncbi:putative branched-chain amino acids ABC transporter ATP-binding protein [Halogeometricum pallidum JCM 14848]|uniref:Putative branched-chain amino acids ABC transporter ATP-binding protein n=1 Tax=Halogeometricum pallidum JCM 14848 TaxID=1227487 RepID=M0CTW7_HALPD|nr:ABC transporter ATP-binding protein [Halogeometricum pallidum]ELZ26656.1 putative branched-chain amino acids ABC transporter ATP-binding protein [Halogeometricum pallidum JCM 14848]